MSQQSGDLITFLRSLRAIREYTPDPVPDEVLRDILEVARWSGSASNGQPVELVVVRDKAVMKQINEHGVRAAATAPLALLIVTPGDPERKDLEVFDDGRMVERLHRDELTMARQDRPWLTKHGVGPGRRLLEVASYVGGFLAYAGQEGAAAVGLVRWGRAGNRGGSARNGPGSR